MKGMISELFSTFKTSEILEIDYGRLNEWIRGFFDPHIKAAGRGTRTKFSLVDLYRLKVFAILVESGIGREYAAGIVKSLKEHPVDSYSGHFLSVGLSDQGQVGYGNVYKGQPANLFNIDGVTPTPFKIIKTEFVTQISINLGVIKKLVDQKIT